MSETALLTAKEIGVRLAGRVVLKDVSLALSPGHLVALVGPNGAGKTTLLRALAGLIPSEGEIEIGGQTLSSLPLRERAKRFGYLPQRRAISWRSAAIRTVPPIRRACRPGMRRRCCARCRRSM